MAPERLICGRGQGETAIEGTCESRFAGHWSFADPVQQGLLQGLYKVEMHDGARLAGVLFAIDGKMMAANSAFAFIGTYRDSDGVVSVEFIDDAPQRRSDYEPLFKTDKITLKLTGGSRASKFFSRAARGNCRAFLQLGDDPDQRRTRRLRCRSGQAGSATAFIRFISGCSTVSTAAIPASWCCMMAGSAAATPSSTTSAPTPAPTADGRANWSTTNIPEPGRTAGVRRL